MKSVLRAYAQHGGPTPHVVATVEIWNELAPGINKKLDEVELTLAGEFGEASDIHAAAEAELRSVGILPPVYG